MNAPLWNLSQPNSSYAVVKKKRILLVDSSRSKRDLRSETMRRLGAEVDCAADVREARGWWRPDLYDLVLVQMNDAAKSRDEFCDDIRKIMPHQQIMFLVGKPEYLAAAPYTDPEESAEEDGSERGSAGDRKSPAPRNGGSAGSQRWGILEACRQISAVRSVSDARAKAIKDRPAPMRDFELTRAARTDRPQSLAEVTREEIK